MLNYHIRNCEFLFVCCECVGKVVNFGLLQNCLLVKIHFVGTLPQNQITLWSAAYILNALQLRLSCFDYKNMIHTVACNPVCNSSETDNEKTLFQQEKNPSETQSETEIIC